MNITIGAVIGLGLLGGIGWLSWKACNSYDTHECYIERAQHRLEVYEINQKVEWGLDRSLGYSTSLSEATEIAKKQGCVLPAEKLR
jgi:hypothetical protein